jgi:hypothetical protein
MIGRWLAVQLTTTSNSCRREGRSASRITSPPKRPASFSPRSSVRLAMAMDFGFLAAKCVAASSIMSPAPTNSTRTWPRSSNSWPARRTAAADMLIEWAPISVEVRTSLATAKERWNSWFSVVPSAPASSAARTASFIWPRIWASPSTIESRPAGDAEGMARRLVVVQRIGMRAQQGRGDAAALGQPLDRVVERQVLGGAVDLGAVAGRDDGGLHVGMPVGAEGTPQALQRGGNLVDREREPTAQVKRRGRVVQAESPD